MLSARAFLLVLIAALFAFSGAARAMPAPVGDPPCHEAPADHGKSVPADAAMTCCIGCMPAPAETAAVLKSRPAERPAYAAADIAAEGRHTAPDPEPPRRRV